MITARKLHIFLHDFPVFPPRRGLGDGLTRFYGFIHGECGAVPLVLLEDPLRISGFGFAVFPDDLTGSGEAHIVGEEDCPVGVEVLTKPGEVIDAEADIGMGTVQHILIIEDAHLWGELPGDDVLDLHDPDGPLVGNHVLAEVALRLHDSQHQAVVHTVAAGCLVDGLGQLPQLPIRDAGLLLFQMNRNQGGRTLFRFIRLMRTFCS